MLEADADVASAASSSASKIENVLKYHETPRTEREEIVQLT